MTNDEDLAPVPSRAFEDFGPGYSDEPEEHQINPLKRLHLLLYGRYRWALVLGIVLGVGGAIAVWFSRPQKYEVVGYVQIIPYVPPVLSVTDQNGMLPMFETFVDLQVSLLQSQRVLDQAGESAEWKALGRNSAGGSPKIEVSSLKVDHARASELVTVGYTDRDPDVAATAVKSILQAYEATSGDINDANAAHRLQLLETLRTNLTKQKRDLSDEILAVANKMGSDNLESQYQFKLQQQNSLESELERIAVEVSFAQAAVPDAATNNPSTQPVTTQSSKAAAATQPTPVPLSRQDVAKIDVQMKEYLSEESRLTLRLNQLRLRLGESHYEVLGAKSDLQALEEQINTLMATYQGRGAEAGSPSPLVVSGNGGNGLSLKELRAREANIRALFEKVQVETSDLGKLDLQIRALKEDRDTVSHKLDETTARIDQLNLESSTASRISILSPGERPTAPVPNKRIPLTAAMGFLGLAAGAGLVALRGLADRRVGSLLHMEQLTPSIPVLGVLPVLPDDFADPGQVSLTAHCVHQIRNLLDADERDEKRRVLAITSPLAGDGKTSLTLALGMSFAVSGSRTLLIDCDLFGGGLTSRLNAIAHRRLGSILKRQGLITERQIQDALLVAGPSHRKLGKALVDLGYVKAQDVQQARARQKISSVGLLDALHGEPLAACMTSVVMKDLFILPLGKAAAENSNQISVKAFRRMIEEARTQFDFILIDTGPILGSIEASVAASVADDVVLAIARGAPAHLVTRIVQLLDSLGGHLAGVVFNRATPGDVAYSKFGSSSRGSLRSLHASSGQRRSNGQPRIQLGAPPRLGPVASAIVTGGSGSATEASPFQYANGSSTKGSVEANGSASTPSIDEAPGDSGAQESINP